MRISDWSSDVCSSDLEVVGVLAGEGDGGEDLRPEDRQQHVAAIEDVEAGQRQHHERGRGDPVRRALQHVEADRKSVVWGKSVSVRVDLGGRRIITTKT